MHRLTISPCFTQSHQYPFAAGKGTINREVSLYCDFIYFKSIDNTLREKIEIKLAGEWLRNNNAMVSTSIITTDERVPFYAGLMRGQYDIFSENKVRDLESIALRKNRDLIIWTKSLKYMKYKPDFDNFSLVKEFQGQKNIILIYRRNS